MKNNGFSLIFSLFLIAALMIISVSLITVVFGVASSYRLELDYQKAYYLAEAGIEYGKSHLLSNPEWNTPGETIVAGTGRFTVIREPGKSFLICNGNAGGARVIIRANVIDHSSYIQREEQSFRTNLPHKITRQGRGDHNR